MKQFSIRRALVQITILFVFVCNENISANVNKVIYYSDAGIQLAIDKSNEGDTVYLPQGKYDIKNTIQINSGILLLGEKGNSTVLENTRFRKDEFWTIKVENVNKKGKARISGISIIGRSPEVTPGILIKNCLDFRIDHCYFRKCSRRAIEIHGKSSGVIDHSQFVNNWYTGIVVYGEGESGWNKVLTSGFSDAIFVEDNEFRQDTIPEMSMAHHIASNNGSYYVFRYNVIKDGRIASHAIDAHGKKFGGERGSRYYEIYNNYIFAAHRWAGINIRGGDGVIYNNVFKGDYVSPIHLMHEGKEGDGNCQYPCTDQIRKLYLWNNTYNGKKCSIYIRFPELIKENRDFFNIEKKMYKPFVYPHPLVK